jgi:hypothetical protein
MKPVTFLEITRCSLKPLTNLIIIIIVIMMLIYTFLNKLLEKQTRMKILKSIVTVVDVYNSNIVLHAVHYVSCVRFTRRFGSWLYSREHNFFFVMLADI